MSAKANTLRDIRRACLLGALKPADLAYWVDTDAARADQSSLRAHIRKVLTDEIDARILVYGHGGSGKSTELTKLVADLGPTCFPVRFSIRDEMNLVAVQAEDLLLVITERLLYAAQNAGLDVSEKSLAPVRDYFTTVTTETKDTSDSTVQLVTEAKVGTGFFNPFVQLLASLKSDVRLNAHSDKTVVAQLRKRPADLLRQIHLVINAVRQALPQGQRLLIIVEDLDKLDIPIARRVFIENSHLLTGIVADIIYTIPIFTFHSPDAGVLHNNFRECGLPMIKVTSWNGDRAAGSDVVRAIVHARVDPAAIETDALDLLITETGGVLQHVFEVLRNAALLTNAAIPLTRKDIELALRQKRSEFWSDIALPYEPVPGVTNIDQLYDRLAEYANRQLKGLKNLPRPDMVNQILLRSCALVEYNGERWYGVHPLVIANLRELGRITA